MAVFLVVGFLSLQFLYIFFYHSPYSISLQDNSQDQVQDQVQDQNDLQNQTEQQIKQLDSTLNDVGPFYNAVIVTDKDGNMFAVPRNETLRPLNSRTSYSWLSLTHPNPVLLEKSKKASAASSGPKEAPAGAKDINFLLKTGHSVVWERLPIHFITTLTRMPDYSIYSDAALRLGTVEIIDSLQNITDEYLTHDELQPYQIQRYLRLVNANLYVKEAKMNNGWLLDRFKNIWMLFDAWERNNLYKWYVFFDDDTSIMVNGLVSWLSKLDHTEPLYLGSPAHFRDLSFGHGGSGVAISRGAMERLFGDRTTEESKNMLLDLTRQLLAEDCGDYMVAYMLREHVSLGLAPYTADYPYAQDKFQGETLFHTLVRPDNMCKEVVSFHHHGAREISIMWEFENHFNKPILYRDYYQSFIHPYLAKTLSAWDNRAREMEFHNDGEGSDVEPYGSADKCREKCMEVNGCVQYRYDPYKRYCGLSTSLTLGRAVVNYPKEAKVAHYRQTHGLPIDRRVPEEEIVSGWILERVDELFLKKSCNVSDEVEITEPFGWWWTSVSTWDI